MKCRYIFAVFCSIALLFGLQFSSASSALQINEAATKILLEDESAKVSLAIKNPSSSAVPAHVKLEIVDTENRVQAAVEQDETVRPGQSALTFLLPFSTSDKKGQELLWYRLRYRIS